MARGTADNEFSPYFTATNMVLGWSNPGLLPRAAAEAVSAAQPPASPAASTSAAAAARGAAGASTSGAAGAGPFTVRRDTTFADILGGARDKSGAFPQLAPEVAKQLIQLSLALPTSSPLLPLVAFYRAQRYRVSHLKEWTTLDAAKVRHCAWLVQRVV